MSTPPAPRPPDPRPIDPDHLPYGTYARAAALWLLGIGLLSLATLYAQMALWPLSAALGLGAALCASTARYVHETAEERAAWAQQRAALGQMALLPELDTVPDCPCCPPEGW